jgi:hypothetical protein
MPWLPQRHVLVMRPSAVRGDLAMHECQQAGEGRPTGLPVDPRCRVDRSVLIKAPADYAGVLPHLGHETSDTATGQALRPRQDGSRTPDRFETCQSPFAPASGRMAARRVPG